MPNLKSSFDFVYSRAVILLFNMAGGFQNMFLNVTE